MSVPEVLAFPQPLTEDGQPDPLLRERARDTPVFPVTTSGGDRAWLVCGQEPVREVLSDTSRFTSMFDTALEKYRDDMVLLDPPEHSRIRKLATRAFTARRIQTLLPGIQHQVTSLLDTMRQAGSPADLVSSLAQPLPTGVLCLALGLPEQDRAAMRRWIKAFTSGAPTETPSDTDAGTALTEMYDYVGRLVTLRRAEPTNDLLSDMIRARIGDDALTANELVATTALMIIAGQETTAKAITRGVLVLLHSGRWQHLVSGDVSAEQVVEEILRHQSPIDTAIFRRATADTQIAGVQIKSGEQVYVSLQMANLDATARKQPYEFDPTRGDQGHVAFGYGPHFCLGAGLARAELAIAFTTLAARFPDLRLTVPLRELTWSVGSVVNAPTTLPVTW